MHKPQTELIFNLNEATNHIKVGGIYYHYKHPDLTYKVLQLAITESDDTICVIYQAEYGKKLIFVRPLHNWLDKVKWEDKITNRFTKI